MPKVITNPNQFRENIRTKIDEKLGDIKLSTNLEKGVFNYAIKEATNRRIVKKWDNEAFVSLYLNHLRSILNNLSTQIIQDIQTGTIAPQTFAFMTHHEMMPEKWKPLIEAKILRDKNKFEQNMAAATDTFTCRKCKGNKCSYYLQQTRSCDEPTTIFVQCLLCNNRWKTQ